MLFHEMSHFLELFSEKLIKSSKRGSLLEKLNCFAKSMIYMLFDDMSHFLQLSSEKFVKTSKSDSLLNKLRVLAKSMSFHAFSRNEPFFPTFFQKVTQNLET